MGLGAARLSGRRVAHPMGEGEEVNCYTVVSLPGIKHRANVGCIFPHDELALFDVLN